MICIFASTASLKNSFGSLSFLVDPSMTSFQGEWNPTTQFVCHQGSHFEPSRNTKTLCDFRPSSQLATDMSFLQLRYLFDLADRLGSCHQSFFYSCLCSPCWQSMIVVKPSMFFKSCDFARITKPSCSRFPKT